MENITECTAVMDVLASLRDQLEDESSTLVHVSQSTVHKIYIFMCQSYISTSKLETYTHVKTLNLYVQLYMHKNIYFNHR